MVLTQLSTAWPSLQRDELAPALAAFDDRRGVVLYGAAGVGKTHLAREVRAELDHRHEGGLRWFMVVGSHADRTVRLSAVESLVVDIPSDVSLRRMAQLVHHRMAAESDGRRALIHVEDAHLLDEASAGLLAQLCRLGTAGLLVETRSTAQQSAPLVALWRDDLLARITVPTFTPDEVETILWAALSGPVDAELVNAVLRTTGGCARLTRELVRAGIAEGTIVQRHGIWIQHGQLRPDDRLVELIATELVRLSPPERDAVELIALAEPVPLAAARPCIPEDVLDQLIAVGIVRLTQGRTANRLAVPVLRLPHPVYAECIRSHVSPTRSHALHTSIQRTAPHQQTLSGQVRWAEWTLECGLPVEAETLVQAARSASHIGRYESAIELATAALDVTADPRLRIEALAVRGRELRFRDRPTQALRDVEDAIILQRVAPADVLTTTDDRLLDLYELRADIEQYGLDDPGRAMETIDDIYTEVIQRGGTMGQVQRYRMSRIARHGWSGDFRPALSVVDELSAGTVAASSWSLQTVGPALLGLLWRGQTHRAVTLAERYAPFASSYDAAMPRVGAEIHLNTFLLHVASGRLVDARRLGADPRVPGGATRLDSALTYAGEGRLLSAEGRWQEADERFRIAHQLFEARDPSGFAPWSYASEAHCALMVGDLDRAEELCRRIDREPLRASRAMEADIRARVITTLHGLGHPDVAGRATDMSLWAEERGHHLAELWALDLIAVTRPQIARQSGAALRARQLLTLVDAPVAPALAQHVEAIVAGDHKLEDAATAQLARFGWWLPRRTSSTLSRREAEVASLVAAGLSSPAIADRLHLSARTVETHLARVYTKLGVNRRSEVAEALRRHSA